MIENEGKRAIFSGDSVFLSAHTGNLLDVEGDSVSARWKEYGTWQTMIVEKNGGGPIFPGDAVFLQAHTHQLIDVEGTAVRARWSERAAWQTLTIDKADARRLAGSIAEDFSDGAAIGLVLGLGGALVCSFLAVVAVVRQKRKLIESSRLEKVHPVSATEFRFPSE